MATIAPSQPLPHDAPRQTWVTQERMVAEVLAGLRSPGQKTLPCKYFYDAVGSTLFEAIAAMPEYGLSVADERLLRLHGDAMLDSFLSSRRAALGGGQRLWIAELGSGNGHKTGWLLQAACRRTAVTYIPIEVSSDALYQCRQRLEWMVRPAEPRASQGLEVQPFAGEYLAGLSAVERRREVRFKNDPLLVLFLGSSLGNFDPEAQRSFLGAVRGCLHAGDGLLLGLDLVQNADRLRAAYDDPAGVTAAFNRNLLAHLNRELGSDFDLRQWQHRVRYRVRQRRVEMHLRSRRTQRVTIPDAGSQAGTTIAFHRGETIWTESSYKFRANEVAAMALQAGFRLQRQWVDESWPFAENLSLAE